jgi:hypothetical protein
MMPAIVSITYLPAPTIIEAEPEQEPLLNAPRSVTLPLHRSGIASEWLSVKHGVNE